MDKFISFFQQLRLARVLTVALAVVVLFVGTACNNGTTTGARPNNPPVQMGGSNNPHKAGGDGYTNYKMSEDPTVNYHNEVNRNDRANDRAALSGNQLLASRAETDKTKMLYPGENATSSRNPNFGAIGQQEAPELMTPQVPAPRQAVIDRNDPEVGILEKAGEAFKDASSFLKDTADTAFDAPEMQPNPGAQR